MELLNGTSVNNTNTMSVSGKINTALEFNGVDDAIDITGLTSTSKSYTFAFWIKTTNSPSSAEYLFDTQSGRFVIAWRGYAGSGNIEFLDAPGTWKDTGIARSDVNDGKWHHIALVFDNSDSTCTPYLDGTAYSKVSYTGKDIGGLTAIGSYYNTTSGSFFEGSLDDFRFYDIALTSQQIQSLIPFSKKNVIEAKFVRDDNEIFNKVWVYGDRILTGARDEFIADGTGSVFTLTDKPHNTSVYVDDVLQEKGGILSLNSPETTSGLKYVVDFTDKKIIFVSGTAAGDNIPSNGGSIIVDYDRSTPILKYVEDVASIGSYGPKTKVITDKNIKDFPLANSRATTFLNEHKDPKLSGTLQIRGIVDVTPGNTCIIDIPFHNVNNQVYTILSAYYEFNKTNNLSDNVLVIKVNKKIADFVDVMKDQILRTKNFETSQLEGTISRLETVTGSVGVQTHYEVWTKSVGSNFIFHSSKHGRLDDTNSRLAYSDAGSQLNVSGGDF